MEQNYCNIDLIEISKKYKEIRRDVDWGQKLRIITDVLHRPGSVIARDIGISIETWKKIVTHVNIPSLIVLVEICSHFHINYDWLIDGRLNGDILQDRNRVRDTTNNIAERVLEIKGRDSVSSFQKKTGLSYKVYQTLQQDVSSTRTADYINSSIYPSASNNSVRIVSETSLKKIADAYNVGFEWLLCGDKAAKDDPVNGEMIQFLWKQSDIRKAVWDSVGHRYYDMIEVPDGLDIDQLDGLASMGDRLKYARKSRKLTLKQLADISLISYHTLVRWEREQVKPDKIGISFISRILEVGEEWIISGDQNKKDYPCDYPMIEYLRGKPELRRKIAIQKMK